MRKSRIFILFMTFITGFFYQPNWIYQNFYYTPRWVDDASWAPNYVVYLFVYAGLSAVFVELLIRFIKKYI